LPCTPRIAARVRFFDRIRKAHDVGVVEKARQLKHQEELARIERALDWLEREARKPHIALAGKPS
jgi:hypothetical protein